MTPTYRARVRSPRQPTTLDEHGERVTVRTGLVVWEDVELAGVQMVHAKDGALVCMIDVGEPGAPANGIVRIFAPGEWSEAWWGEST